jgi:FAD/FMN-containing dehydrogenase
MIAAWATEHGVRATTAADWPAGDFRDDPRLDFSRCITRTPGCVLHPTDRVQLAACLRRLAADHIPFTIRAAAHSAGGQVLIDGGAVIDVRGLRRVISDDPAAQIITVEAGAWWLDVVEQLAPSGRRPIVLTDNARSSIGGTLAVGGFGDASHRAGLQAEHVKGLTVITLDGATHVVHPGDELFDYTLCGRGQLAVIVDATLATVAKPMILSGRMLEWRSLAAFFDAAVRVVEGGYYDFFRAKMLWQPGLPVTAVAGDLGDAITPIEQVAPDRATALEQLDLLALLREDPHARWDFASPSLELVVPLPAGLAIWSWLIDRITEAGLHEYMPRGTSLMVMRPPSRLPLAPFPPCELAMMIALRLELPPAEAPRVVPILRALGRHAVEHGARVYLMSIELEMPDFLDHQFGTALPSFRALKDRHDPHRLLDPWLL